jgi:hypothetical protein
VYMLEFKLISNVNEQRVYDVAKNNMNE